MKREIQTRLEVLREIFPDYRFTEAKNEFITWCPNREGCNGNHHKRKLQINLNKNAFNCWVCNYSGFITKLLNSHSDKDKRERYYSTIDFKRKEGADAPKHALKLPEGSSFLLDVLDDPEAADARWWLRERCGASDEVIFQQKINFCQSGDYKNRLIFPSYSESGILNFFVSRDVKRMDRWKYLNCGGVKSKDIIFNEILIDWSKPIILFEGVKSYLKHLSLGNLIPIMGSRFGPGHELFSKSVTMNVPCVYLGLDHEAEEKSLKIMDLYNYYGIDTRLIDLADVNQPDEIDTKDIAERIKIAKRYSKKDLLDGMIDRITRNL